MSNIQRLALKHKITLTDDEIDSIRTSLGQVIAKGITMPELVRLDYKLEKLRQSKQRTKRPKLDNQSSSEPEESIEKSHDLPSKAVIRIVKR